MEILRDPIWQFVGAVIAFLSAVVPALVWLLRKKQREASMARDEAVIAELKKHMTLPRLSHSKHKKRRVDGVLASNLSFDFFNQFPVPVSVLAAHVDITYTPENFGGEDWLSVFRRFIEEGYLVPVDGTPVRKLKINSKLAPGPKLQSFLDIAAATKREVAGLD